MLKWWSRQRAKGDASKSIVCWPDVLRCCIKVLKESRCVWGGNNIELIKQMRSSTANLCVSLYSSSDMASTGHFEFASYSYRTRAKGHQSESGGEDDDIAEIGAVKKTDVAEVEFTEPSAENPHWSATFGKEFDATSAIIRIKTYRRKVTESEFNAVVNSVTSAEEDRQVRYLSRTWRDEGILPDVLYLLWCRKKEKGPESLLASLSQGIAKVTFQQALDMLAMVARFLVRFERLRAEERFIFSMDQQQTNKLLAFQSKQKWVILAVPTVRITKKNKSVVDTSEVEESGGEQQPDDDINRRSAEGSVAESADPYGIEGERWALHTRLHLDHIEHLGEEMAKELDDLTPEGWEEPPWSQADDQVMAMMAERAEKQFQTTSYWGMVHQLVYHARGYTVGSLGKWLPDGAQTMLAKLMEEEHLRPPSRGAPFGSEIRQVEGVKPLYHLDHDQILLDCREKTAVDSYEMGEGQSSSAMVCVHNLFNMTRHLGFATYFSQGILDEESGSYVQLPVVRLIEVLAQHLVAYGTPEEVTTAQMYFFKRVSRWVKSGGDETFLLADTVESREEAE